MFVRDFIHVAQPFETVAPHFVTDATWLIGLAEDAASSVRELSSPRNGDAAVPDTGPVHCETGPVRVRHDSLVVPLHFAAANGGPGPALDADLEVSPVGPGLSQLTLSATYRRPPPSTFDDAIVQRTAEVVARRFLQELAVRISDPERAA